MNKTDIKNLADLGVFSLGVSYLLYFFLQYLFTPLCWWLAQHIESLGWMNDVLVLFELQGLEVFTIQSLYYSMLGIIAFNSGYYFFPAKLVRIKHGLIVRKWNFNRAEQIFWLLFLAGFSIKLVKLLSGIDIQSSIFIERGLVSNPVVLFFLSLNWFHWIGLVVINVAYQEAKKEKHYAMKRLKISAYTAALFVIVASLAGGSKMATLAPVLGMLIIKQYYTSRHIPIIKYACYIILLVLFVLFMQYFISEMIVSTESLARESTGFNFALFYILFHRLNMSQVVAAVLEKGQQAYPDGTLGQFWVDMTLYGFDKKNVFDGNEFGQAVGIAKPGDNVTGFASTNMGELFINFDLFGIVFGMLVTGILYKIIFSSCQQRSPIFVMLYALMWPILIHGMESPVTVLYSTSIKMISLCLIVHIAITYKFSRSSIQKNISSKDVQDVAT